LLAKKNQFMSEAPTHEPTFFHNPYLNGKVPANVYLATEARLRAAYEGIYDLFNRHRDTPWSNEERVSVVLQPEWNLGTGSRHPVNTGALIKLVITAVRAYVVFVQQNEPVDPQEFRVKATELAFEMLEIYRLTALHRAADFRVWCVLLTASRCPLTASRCPLTASRYPLTASRYPLTAWIWQWLRAPFLTTLISFSTLLIALMPVAEFCRSTAYPNESSLQIPLRTNSLPIDPSKILTSSCSTHCSVSLWAHADTTLPTGTPLCSK
jgi:hypothetical protein